MREVGVHEAKTHSSRLLREVEAGTEIVILRGGKPVAQLVPLRARAPLEAGRLPRHHRDPFDRILVTQARHLDVPIITADPLITAYGVAVLRVGG